jgi:fatty-acyl-CoA synthase
MSPVSVASAQRKAAVKWIRPPASVSTQATRNRSLCSVIERNLRSLLRRSGRCVQSSRDVAAMSERALAYAHGASNVPLRGETIGRMWTDVVAAHGERDALVSCQQGIRWTYAEFDARVERCARALMAEGVAKGDRVGIWSPNNAEWVIVQLATARIGAILVNLNPSYRAHELEYALRQSGCSFLVNALGFKDADYVELLAAVDAPSLRRTVALNQEWDALLERAGDGSVEQLRQREAELNFDDPINIQYTSGTTGFPKGATLSHHNILNNGFFIGETLGYRPADRVCLPVPFYHCFGMVLGNLAIVTHGACIVIPSETFEARAALEAVESERCTSLYGVPTMFIAELADPGFGDVDLSTLRTGIMAGSPCPVEVMKQVQGEMNMEEVTICYGMTETSPVSTQTRRDDPLEKRVGTVGQVHPHIEVKIVDPATGLIVRRAEAGELCTRGYSVMLGYWDDEEATRQAIDQARWIHTGDLATMDDDGYVNIVGRIKDMIIRGGENIYPREIEEFLYTNPAIADVQVIGVPNEGYGEIVCAWVVLKPGAALDEEELKEFCRGKIARFKIPQYVRFVDSFPMTVTGKIQKFLMREIEMKERELVETQTA